MTVYVMPLYEEPIGKVFNVTSKGNFHWLSPFTLGPVDLYDGYFSQNVENAWQYSKVYKQHDDNGPTQEYWDWAVNGWNKRWADRYPMGKGAVPEYSYWDGEKLGYIEARKKIYAPLYSEAIRKDRTRFFEVLCSTAKKGDITIQDYDAYNHHKLGMTLYDVMHEEKRKMGHGFVLAMMIAKYG